MAQITGQGNTYNLPNYAGELFTANLTNAPLLSAIGGLNGGMQTQNYVFPVTSEYDFPAAAQPAVTEADANTAPDGTEAVREQVENVTQIFHQAVSLTYEKLSNGARLSEINTAGSSNPVDDELAWQIDYNLRIIARNIEYTILNGVYNKAAATSEANKTRGVLAAADLTGGTSVDATSVELSKDMLQEMFRTMHSNGALFSNPVIIANGLQRQRLSDIYGYAPQDRNVGGVNINQIETNFGIIGVLPAHRFMPGTSLAVLDLDVVAPVFQPVPGKGNFFYEELSKTGASEKGQLYGKFGFDHGPAFAHGKIINLAE